jgi:hypothetical protein
MRIPSSKVSTVGWTCKLLEALIVHVLLEFTDHAERMSSEAKANCAGGHTQILTL